MLNRIKSPFVKKLLLVTDILLLGVAFFLAYSIREDLFTPVLGPMQKINQHFWILIVSVPVWVTIYYIFGLYNYKQPLFKLLGRAATAALIDTILIASLFFFLNDNTISRVFYGIFILIGLLLTIVSRSLLKLTIILLHKNGKTIKKVLVVGTNALALKFTEYIKANPEIMVNIIGYINIRSEITCIDSKIIGDIEALPDILVNHVVDEVVFALPRDYAGDIEPYILECEAMGITASMIVNIFNLNFSNIRLGKLGNLPIMSFYTVRFEQWHIAAKRIMDIIGAIIGLAITSIVSIFVAPAIWIESPGPILFSQDRVGQNGRVFRCYKFRSMYPDAEERKKDLLKHNQMNGAIFKIKDDPRVTKVGRILRATSIDELPQFWNVLKGEMSLVGTRPPTLDEVKHYKNYHWKRLSIKPGMTGQWQISGRNVVKDFDEIVKLDNSYIDNWTFWLDIKILFKTVRVVFTRHGAC